MPLARIYQGRISKLELIDDAKKAPAILQTFDAKAPTNQENPLWRHHEIFQSAINYFLLALAAMARGIDRNSEHLSVNERLAANLIERTKNAWDNFPKTVAGPGKPLSIKMSLKRWLQLDDNTTFDQACDSLLGGNDSDPAVLRLALQLLLEKCSGDSGVQQGGRGYLPRLCDEAATPTYDFSKSNLDAQFGLSKLAAILHSEDFQQSKLEQVANEMDLSWSGVKLQPGKTYNPEESKKRLTEALAHLLKIDQGKSANRATEALANFPNWQAELSEFKAQIDQLPADLTIPRNRKASPDLTFATLVFKHFPSQLTATILSLFVKKPKEDKKQDSDGPNYAEFGDDPIKLSRGDKEKRGYVFPAFTALPCWNPKSPGQPVWKEFDIAAFKEALKSLNQFNQKTAERTETEQQLTGKIAILLGSEPPQGWKPAKNESGEAEAKPECLDPNLLSLALDLEGELTAQLADTVIDSEKAKTHSFGNATYHATPGQWRVSRASLRGLPEIAEKWNKLADKAESSEIPLSKKELESVVKDFQREEKNKKQVGSLPLLLALCQEKYHPLWRTREATTSDDESEHETNRFLYDVAHLHQSVRDWLRSTESINLTPAEPRHSRRLYMFSDIAGKEKVAFREDGVFETTIVAEKEGTLHKQRARLHFTSPRLRRDQLLGGEESRWLQPMTSALGFSLPEPDAKFDSAVSLMPDFDREGNTRFLLNFPKTIDETWLKNQIGSEAIWSGQFNGVKDKNIHLHWPQNEPKTKQAKYNPWWKNPTVITNGFTTLSVDLGQRTAGAWAMLKVTSTKPETKRPWHSIGHDGECEWFAEVLRTGMFRLPGEDQKVIRRDIDNTGKPIKGKLVHQRELAGSAGRNADSKEYEEALQLAIDLKAINYEEVADDPQKAAKAWVGEDRHAKSFPEQNSSLLALANRRLSRLGTFHRWSCIATRIKEKPELETKLLEGLRAELEHWHDPEVAHWKSVFEAEGIAAFGKKAGDRFAAYRDELEGILLQLAHRTVALRGKRWVLKTREKANENGTHYGSLEWEELKDQPSPKVRGQRGLSMDRLEQLETLRKLFLRYNRSLDKVAGKPSKVGFGFSHDAGEPAQLLLDKIDNMKEQRVNQTAHLILAQALGVRLKTDKTPPQQRKEKDIHGEYEKIPNRQPVDFIVIENLDRYLTSQGRAPSENRRLMKWAHRAVRDKLKMLAEEPFGIPVVEAPAAYTSRFCAKTSQPGSRCWEKHSLDKWLHEQLEKKSQTPPASGKPDLRESYGTLLGQFKTLAGLNEIQKNGGKKPRTLLLPKPGGPLFCPSIDGPIVQADANAAINIGLRALAAPEALHLIHKVRASQRNGQFSAVTKNAREKAALASDPTIHLTKEPSSKLAKSSSPNFFHLSESSRPHYGYDNGTITDARGKCHQIVSGIALHSTTDSLVLRRIIELNAARLEKWDGDDIPMH